MEKDNIAEMSFLGHLEDLRWHIVRSCVAVVLCMIGAFAFKGFIFDVILTAPKSPDFITARILCKIGACINDKPFQLVSTEMAGQFSAHIMISMVAGVIIAFPYIVYQIWSFIAPALYENERKYARGAVFWISFLFLLGVLFGYYIIVPLSVHFLGSYQVSSEIANMITLNSYFQVVSSVTLATGIIFELPIFILFLTKIGVVTPDFLVKYRKHAFIIILIVAAVITPPDVFSQILVTIPLMGLFEASIIASRRMLKKQKESENLPVKPS